MTTETLNDAPSNLVQQLAANLQRTGAAYTPGEMLLNMLLALALGLLLASVYRFTHKGLSYSQSFTLTIVFIATIVAITMMAIESSLARAFALVGALSVIRFRTVVKDTKDTSYVFAGLAVGLAAGTSNHTLAVMGAVFISAVALGLHRINFGADAKGEFMIRFTFDRSKNTSGYVGVLKKYCRHSKVLYLEPSADGASVHSTIDVALRRNEDIHHLLAECAAADGVSNVRLTTARAEVEY